MPDSISLERLQEVLDYDAASGVFRRKTGIRAGEIAGWDCRGYTRIEIDGERARAHRLSRVSGCTARAIILATSKRQRRRTERIARLLSRPSVSLRGSHDPAIDGWRWQMTVLAFLQYILAAIALDGVSHD